MYRNTWENISSQNTYGHFLKGGGEGTSWNYHVLFSMCLGQKKLIISFWGHFSNKSANALALCHPPSASFCSVLAVQWSSRIFTHDRYNIPSDILIEFEVNLGIIIEKYA